MSVIHKGTGQPLVVIVQMDRGLPFNCNTTLTRNAVSVITALEDTSAMIETTTVNVMQHPMIDADLTLGTSSGEEAA